MTLLHVVPIQWSGRNGPLVLWVHTSTPVPTRWWTKARRGGPRRLWCADSPTSAAGSSDTPARPRTSTNSALRRFCRTVIGAIIPTVMIAPS